MCCNPALELEADFLVIGIYLNGSQSGFGDPTRTFLATQPQPFLFALSRWSLPLRLFTPRSSGLHPASLPIVPEQPFEPALGVVLWYASRRRLFRPASRAAPRQDLSSP